MGNVQFLDARIQHGCLLIKARLSDELWKQIRKCELAGYSVDGKTLESWIKRARVRDE